jgi:hypothetical protein
VHLPPPAASADATVVAAASLNEFFANGWTCTSSTFSARGKGSEAEAEVAVANGRAPTAQRTTAEAPIRAPFISPKNMLVGGPFTATKVLQESYARYVHVNVHVYVRTYTCTYRGIAVAIFQ